MQHLAEQVAASLTEQLRQTPRSTSVNDTPAPPADQPMARMRRIWERMVSMYGHKWASEHGVAPQNPDGSPTIAGETWAKGLAGMTGGQLAEGLRACLARNDGWPPSLPEYRAMCYAIPTLPAVQLEFRGLAGERTAYATLVWQAIDGERWRLASAEQRDRLVRDAYELAREHVMRGGALPELAAAHLDPPRHVAPPKVDPEGRERARQEAAEALGLLSHPPVRHTTPDGKMAAAGPDA